jgi:hypothetical protein
MASQAASVPREHELLCEHCGYGLDGLPDSTLCPECGKPVSDSTSAALRAPTAWETPGLPFSARFLKTTWAVLTQPKGFFRHYRSRLDPRASRGFAFVHYWLAGYLFAVSAAMHYLFLLGRRVDASTAMFFALLAAAILCPIVFALITGIRWLAGRLSALESKYHGLRLPLPVVTRALHYHAAHLLPVAVITAVITTGYRLLLAAGWLDAGTTEMGYLYGLCGWVIFAAGYLFWSYWMAMKSVMYANR